MITDLKWLDRITFDSDQYEFFKQTVMLEHNAKWYAFKSDGHMFVAVESNDATLPVCLHPQNKLFCHIETATVHPVVLDGLKVWLGAAQWDASCPDCNGKGTTPGCKRCGFTETCRTCNGDGGEAKPRYGKLFGVLINKNLLARALSGIECETIIQVLQNGAEEVQYVTGPGWLVGIMPLKGELMGPYEADSFPLPEELI